MRTVLRVVAHALVLALLWSASVGHAQPAAPNKARARELYAQGQQLFRQGDFSGAQRAFEDAYRAVPNPVVLLSVAECQVRTENFAGALSSLQQYLAERPSAPDKAQVEVQIQNLESKPGLVTVESAPPGAQIAVDGAGTGNVTPFELSLRAGTHTIALTAPGHLKLEQRVEVSVGARQRLALTLTPEPVAAAPKSEKKPATDKEQAEPKSGRGRHGTAGVWTSLAIAGVTLATGTGLGVAALQRDKDYNADLKSTGTADKAAKRQGERLALFSDVTLGIAAVAGVTALVLYLTSAEPDEGGEQAILVAPELRPSEVGLHGRVRF
jgi:hypothetical protein